MKRMAANRLSKMLTEINSDLHIVALLKSVEESASYFQNNEMPELIFMDIQLSDGISFELFDLISITCPVVFTTAFDEYALKAFQVHAMDYLLKPIKKTDLEHVIHRFYDQQLSVNENRDALQHPEQTKKILIKLGQTLKVLTLNHAHFYYSENKITFYMDEEGKRYPIDYSLDSLEQLLDSNAFFRVQSSVYRESVLHSEDDQLFD